MSEVRPRPTVPIASLLVENLSTNYSVAEPPARNPATTAVKRSGCSTKGQVRDLLVLIHEVNTRRGSASSGESSSSDDYSSAVDSVFGEEDLLA